MDSSLLERLIDYSPHLVEESSFSIIEDENKKVSNLVQDIENLLNTKKYFLSWPSFLNELNISVLKYGLEEFSTFLREEEGYLSQSIKQALSNFEPRLKNIIVSFVDQEKAFFIVEAEIYVEKIFQKIHFNLDHFINHLPYKFQIREWEKG